MSNPNFLPTHSTDEIWRGDDSNRCLTDDLDAMDTIHSALPNTYATKNHTHSEYAAVNHTHSDYATIEELDELATSLESLGSTPINNGDDLNNITDEGIYYRAYAGSSSNVVSNVPSAIGSATFVLEVFNSGAEGQKVQRITKCDKTAAVVLQRSYYQNAWGSWKTIIDNQKILWSGAYYMNNTQSITFPENISDQVSGVTLVFSGYNPNTGVANDGSFNMFFVPKKFVELHHGCGMSFTLNSQDGSTIGYKYIYISNGGISGYYDNAVNATKNGIAYSNKSFVLRYVIGC